MPKGEDEMAGEARNARRGGRDHAREDLARAENRINVLLYATQGIPQFWSECRALLGLAPDAYLRRVILDGRPERPDFLVYEGGVATRWIESELADRNDEQLGNYTKKKLDPPGVISLVGPSVNREGDPSLEQIAEVALVVAAKIEPENKPGAEALEFLANLIREHVRPARLRAAQHAIPERLMQEEWFREAAGPLLELMDDGTVVNKPVNPGSLSLRLRRSLTRAESLSLFSQQGQGDFEFPRPDVLEEHLADPLRSAVLPTWRALLDSAVPGWPTRTNGRRRVVVPTSRVQANATNFAKAFAAFQNALSPPPPMSGSQPNL
jgi:hypothetical protein